MSRSAPGALLLGEWACLGVLYDAPAHGFAVASRLKPAGDVGRVWSVSRPLTYRSLNQLAGRGYIHEVGEEPGLTGGNRTLLAATRRGRAQFRRWVATPVVHLRDLRSELLLKLVLADLCGLDISEMLARQREHISELADTLATQTSDPGDVVAMWRAEASAAALRFLDHLAATRRAPTP